MKNRFFYHISRCSESLSIPVTTTVHFSLVLVLDFLIFQFQFQFQFHEMRMIYCFSLTLISLKNNCADIFNHRDTILFFGCHSINCSNVYFKSNSLGVPSLHYQYMVCTWYIQGQYFYILKHIFNHLILPFIVL